MTTVTRALALVVAVDAVAARRLDRRPHRRWQHGAPNTVLTVKIRSCEGCEVTLFSYLDGDMDAGWTSDQHAIQNGKAAFVVPTEKTEGLSVRGAHTVGGPHWAT